MLALALSPGVVRAYPTVEGQPARYVIITGDALAASFQPLADWKTQTGLPAVVRSLSDVIAAHPVAWDDAERVRLEIRDAWLAGAQWVLLGGGAGVVPRRYAHTTFFGGKDLLTDLYFQCLDGNWDADGDHVFGEGFFDAGNPGDHADLSPEVWLGRAPVLTPEEAQRFVAKTLQYERTPAGDYEHLSLECAEVLFPQDWLPGQVPALDGAELVEPLLPFFDLHPAVHVARLYENFTDSRWRPGALAENRAAVLDSLRRGSNQTLFVGHGYIHGIVTGVGSLDESDFLSLTIGNRQLAALVAERHEREPRFAPVGAQPRHGVELGDREVARVAVERAQPRPLPRAPEPDAGLGLGGCQGDRAPVGAAREHVLFRQVAEPPEHQPVARETGLEGERLLDVAHRALPVLDCGASAIHDLERPAVERSRARGAGVGGGRRGGERESRRDQHERRSGSHVTGAAWSARPAGRPRR
jgi:hypothetical protein